MAFLCLFHRGSKTDTHIFPYYRAGYMKQTFSHNDPSSTPETDKGNMHIDRPSSFTDKLEQVKIAFPWAPQLNCEQSHTALFTCERLLQQPLSALQTNRHVRLIYSWRQDATPNFRFSEQVSHACVYYTHNKYDIYCHLNACYVYGFRSKGRHTLTQI